MKQIVKVAKQTDNVDDMCLQPMYARGTSSCGDITANIPLRCRKCEPCQAHRKKKFFAIGLDRIQYAYRTAPHVRHRVMSFWTFGTNLKDEYQTFSDQPFKKVWTNRLHVLEKWKLMKKFLYRRFALKKQKFECLVWVLEAGEHGYLHIHCLISGFVPHKWVRSVWSKYSNVQEPNVNFKKSKRNGGSRLFMAYMAKYMSKVSKYPKYVTGKHDYAETKFDSSKDLIRYGWGGSMVYRGLPKIPKFPMNCIFHKDTEIVEWMITPFDLEIYFTDEIEDFFDD